MNLQLLYLLPLAMGNDIVPKYIHFLFGLGTTILIFVYLRKRVTLIYSVLGAIIFLSTPVILKLSISVYVDLGLIFFSWASMLSLFNWFRSGLKLKYLIWAGVLCGLAMGIKYNGLLVFLLLTFLAALIQVKSPEKVVSSNFVKSLVSPIIFAVVSLAVFSPWMIRNMLWTGNPVYPLYHHIFTDDSAENQGQPISMYPWLQRKLVYHERAIQTALIPVRIFFQGKDDDPRYFDGRLNPIMFFFPILSFFRIRKLKKSLKFEMISMACFSVLYLLYASFIVDMRVRYIVPIIPPVVILTVMGIKRAFSLIENRPIIFKIFLSVILCCLLSLNAKYIYDLMLTVEPLQYLSGKTTRSEYIERFRPEFPVVSVANGLSGDSVKLMALFLGNRRYYFDKNVEFAIKKFQNTVEQTISAEEMAKRLKEQGFTHLIVRVDLFKAWEKSVFSKDKLIMINQFFNKCGRPVEDRNGFVLFAIPKTKEF